MRVLDLASGAGDLPVRLSRRACRSGLALELAGCDRNPVAVEHARRRAEQAGAKVSFFVQDALAGPLPEDYDVVMCSLFLHHLEETAAGVLLAAMAGAVRRMVLVNDLARGAGGWALAHLAARLLTTSPVMHVGAPRSVEAAFTVGCTLASRAAEPSMADDVFQPFNVDVKQHWLTSRGAQTVQLPIMPALPHGG